jgi:hypothetical protein
VSVLTNRLAGGFVAALLATLVLGSGSAFGWHGPPPVTIQPQGNVTRDVSVATNESSDALAAWRQVQDGAWVVRAAIRPGAAAWPAPVTVSTPGSDVLGFDSDLSANGTAALVWHSWDGSESLVQSSIRMPGAAWEAPQTLSFPGQAAFHPQVEVDDAGNVLAAWTGAAGLQLVQRLTGGSWSAATTLSGPGALKPAISLSGSGHAAAAWLQGDGLHFRVQGATAAAGGSWSAPQWLSAPGEDADSAAVGIDDAGNATAAWDRFDGSRSIVQRSSRPAGGAWERARDIAPRTGPGKDPRVDLGRSGHLTVSWISAGDLVTVLRPPGGTFDDPVFIASSKGDVAVDSQGNLIAVWNGVLARWKPFHAPAKDLFDLAPDIFDARDPAVGTHGPAAATSVWRRENGAIQASAFDIESGQEDDEEDIDGTEDDDELFGTEGDDVFRAYGGNDKIYGRGGNDVVYGGGGVDRVFGGRGDDRLYGGRGRDFLFGGAGRDMINGGRGRDVLSGELGRDFLSARDGVRDYVAGGNGLDRFRIDKKLDRFDRLELGF